MHKSFHNSFVFSLRTYKMIYRGNEKFMLAVKSNSICFGGLLDKKDFVIYSSSTFIIIMTHKIYNKRQTSLHLLYCIIIEISLLLFCVINALRFNLKLWNLTMCVGYQIADNGNPISIKTSVTPTYSPLCVYVADLFLIMRR